MLDSSPVLNGNYVCELTFSRHLVETPIPLQNVYQLGMPIDNETFQQGRKEQNIQAEVREFLASHEQQAFTVPEIAAEICEPTLSTSEESKSETLSEYQLDMIAVKVSLIDLYRRGAIETRVIADGEGARKYYRVFR